MNERLSLLDGLGAASLAPFWVPLAAWTAVWLVAEGLARWAPAPASAYRLAQAALLALPAGLALAALIDPASPWTPTPTGLPDWAVAGTPGAAGPATAPAAQVSVLTVLGAATVLAGLAAVAGAARLSVQAVAVGRLRRALPTVEVPGLGVEAGEVAARIGLRVPPRVVATPADIVPMTLGALRPTVVVPAALGPADRRMAVAHELAHVRQLDPLLSWAEAAVAALLPWHPGVRRLARACALRRELACDAAVLADPLVSRRRYAALVSSVAASAAARPSTPALHMADRPSHVHQRLLAMTHASPAPRFAGLLALSVLLVGAALMTAGRAAAQPARVTVEGRAADGTAARVTVEGSRVVIGDAVAAPADSTEPVVYVDGERVDGPVTDLDIYPDDIYSIEVFKGDEARSRFGEDAVIRVTTKAAAEAAGLPPAPGPSQGGAAPRPPQPPTAGGMIETAPFPDSDQPPLYVVDGVVVDRADIEGIDPDTIESIEVFQVLTPALEEQYGEAAAGGLVLVTTKAE